jgi:hypothetical protein
MTIHGYSVHEQHAVLSRHVPQQHIIEYQQLTFRTCWKDGTPMASSERCRRRRSSLVSAACSTSQHP